MPWCAESHETTLAAVRRIFGAATFPSTPAGFTPLSRPRRMRAVLRGTLPGPDGPIDVVVKWHHPHRMADRMSRWIRGSKGAREGRVLRAMQAAAVRVPAALAYATKPDVLVTRYVPGLQALPHPDTADRTDTVAVARLLARAHAAGLDARDLHAGNLAHDARQQVWLTDLGSARIGTDGGEALDRLRLARLTHTLLGTARYAQRHRALRAYTAERWPTEARAKARHLARAVEREARAVARRYRQRRDRRTRPGGRHFPRFDVRVEVARGSVRAHGMRRVDITSELWAAQAAAWATTPSSFGDPLKVDGSVRRLTTPSGTLGVLHAYRPAGLGRRPRAERVLQRAFALENRRVAAPLPWLTAHLDSRSSVYLSSWLPGNDLHALSHDRSPQGWAALAPPLRHRALARLGRTLRRMHDAGVQHRDLKAPNLVWMHGDDGGTFAVVDVEGVSIARGVVPWPRRARDLARLDASVAASQSERLRVARAYLGVWPRAKIDARTLAAWIRPHVDRKRGPAGLPR